MLTLPPSQTPFFRTAAKFFQQQLFLKSITNTKIEKISPGNSEKSTSLFKLNEDPQIEIEENSSFLTRQAS